MTLTPSTPSYDCPRPSESISLSIHFGTLYFYRNPEKILQECSALQRSTVQCSATIQPYLKTPPICSHAPPLLDSEYTHSEYTHFTHYIKSYKRWAINPSLILQKIYSKNTICPQTRKSSFITIIAETIKHLPNC